MITNVNDSNELQELNGKGRQRDGFFNPLHKIRIEIEGFVPFGRLLTRNQSERLPG